MCLVYRAGELSAIQYGRNEVLGTCRTEHVSPFLLSSVHAPARGQTSEALRLAYLIDLHTLRVLDLLDNSTITTVTHDHKIDWLVSDA